MTCEDLSADFAALLDDAALFPPGDVPMAEAVAGYLRRRLSAAAGFLGPFVVTASRLPELAQAVAARPSGAPGLQTSVILDVPPDLSDLPAAIAVLGLEVAIQSADD